MDKTLDAAGVLQKLKDQTIKLVFTAAAVPDQYLKNDDFDPPPAAYPKGMNAWYCPGAFDFLKKTWQRRTAVATATRRR